MSKEAILQVISAEDEAKRIVDAANEKAALLVKEARAKAECDYSEHKKNLGAEYKRRIELVGEDAEILVTERIGQAERDAEIMCRDAQPNIPLAVREVVRRIVNECQ